MKTLFIPAKSNIEIKIVPSELKKIKANKIGIATTIQHFGKVNEMLAQGRILNGILAGKILGCNVDSAKKIEKNIDAFLYIGTGEFHPIKIALETNKEVYTMNPSTGRIKKIDEKDIKIIRNRTKAGLVKFLSSSKIGILVSTKKGQQNLEAAKQIENLYPEKKFYVFAFNTLNINDLENFPFIECWINTACPRIATDDSIRAGKAMINLEDILKFRKESEEK